MTLNGTPSIQATMYRTRTSGAIDSKKGSVWFRGRRSDSAVRGGTNCDRRVIALHSVSSPGREAQIIARAAVGSTSPFVIVRGAFARDETRSMHAR
jgi:hypothetical protein